MNEETPYVKLRLHSLSVRNYKSLKKVTFSPENFAAIIGPNAAGKSNFASAIHFLSEVYKLGLETAVANKGGYENIAFRRSSRSTAPIEFEVVLEMGGSEIHQQISDITPHIAPGYGKHWKVCHRFSFITTGKGIRQPFHIVEESFVIKATCEHATDKEIVKITRNIADELMVETANNDPVAMLYQGEVESTFQAISRSLGSAAVFRSKSSLFIEEKAVGLLQFFAKFVAGFKVYQFSNSFTRQPGVPLPNPVLSPLGENLPGIIDWMQVNSPGTWQFVMSGMQDIMPSLQTINIETLHNQRLGIFFTEEGVTRSWGVEELSDGTMHALAILVAVADSRNSLLLLEEPENSVHPWIVRVIVNHLREISQYTNVIVTSYSPILTNLLRPEEIWIASRRKGETTLNKLTMLDASVKEGWENGDFRLSEFLDSGAVGQSVPGGVW